MSQQGYHLSSVEGFNVLGQLGSGASSTVYSAIHVESGVRCALKRIMKSTIETEQELIQIRKELDIQKDLVHPHIAGCFGFLEDEKSIILVIELVDGLSLLDTVNMNQHLEEADARKFFIQLMSAVRYIHLDKGVVHRDIKLDNILVSARSELKLIDFGYGNRGKEQYETQCGTYPYAAPELFSDRPYTPAIDIWSCGIVLYGMIYGVLPFDAPNVPDLIDMIKSVEPAYPPTVPPAVIDLLKRMLNKDPGRRITITEILRHPWVMNSPNWHVIADDTRVERDLRVIDGMVHWEMKQLGRNSDVDINGDSEDAMVYRLLRFKTLESTETSRAQPMLPVYQPGKGLSHSLAGLPHLVNLQTVQQSKVNVRWRQHSEDDSPDQGAAAAVSRGRAPLSRFLPRQRTQHPRQAKAPTYNQGSITQSQQLPVLTFV